MTCIDSHDQHAHLGLLVLWIVNLTSPSAVGLDIFPQILSKKGLNVERYGDERIIKTFLQVLVEDIPTEWTYVTSSHEPDALSYRAPPGRKETFINYRAGMFAPANSGPAFGWPSSGILCARPRRQLALFTGTRVCQFQPEITFFD